MDRAEPVVGRDRMEAVSSQAPLYPGDGPASTKAGLRIKEALCWSTIPRRPCPDRDPNDLIRRSDPVLVTDLLSQRDPVARHRGQPMDGRSRKVENSGRSSPDAQGIGLDDFEDDESDLGILARASPAHWRIQGFRCWPSSVSRGTAKRLPTPKRPN